MMTSLIWQTVPKFDEGECIGVRKRYPITNTPYEGLWAQQELLQIPKAEATHFSSPALPVTQFLKINLLPLSTEIVMTKPQT
jgi:hypothetical protein